MLEATKISSKRLEAIARGDVLASIGLGCRVHTARGNTLYSKPGVATRAGDAASRA